MQSRVTAGPSSRLHVQGGGENLLMEPLGLANVQADILTSCTALQALRGVKARQVWGSQAGGVGKAGNRLLCCAVQQGRPTAPCSVPACAGQREKCGHQAAPARVRSRVLMREGAGAASSAASTRAVFLGERAGRGLDAAGSASPSCSAAAGRVAVRPRPRRCLAAVAGVAAAAAAASSRSCTAATGSSSAAVRGVAACAALRLLRGAVRGVRGVRAPPSAAPPASSRCVEMTGLEGGSGRKREVVCWYMRYLRQGWVNGRV